MSLKVSFFKKRILLFMPEYVWGGAETQFRFLIDWAENNSWPLDVVIEHMYQTSYDNNNITSYKCVRFFDFQWHDASLRKKKFDIIRFLLKNCIKDYIQYNKCLIYLPNDIEWTSVLKCFGIKIVYSERNDASFILMRPNYFKKLIQFDCVIANSLVAQTKMKSVLKRDVIYIRNGKQIPDNIDIKPDHRIKKILVPATINTHKNQLMVLKFLYENRDFQGTILFAGQIASKIYASRLRGFIRKHKLQNRVKLLSYVEDLGPLYRTADLVILPSFVEGTPNVVLEAFAYCRPVIVSDIDVERDLVRNPNMRFNPRSPQEIMDCIRYIESMSDAVYRRMVKMNREFVIENYNVGQMVKAYHDLLMS